MNLQKKIQYQQTKLLLKGKQIIMLSDDHLLSKSIVIDNKRQATMNDIEARDYSFFVISIQK